MPTRSIEMNTFRILKDSNAIRIFDVFGVWEGPPRFSVFLEWGCHDFIRMEFCTFLLNKLPKYQASRIALEVSLLDSSIFRTWLFFVVSLPFTRQLNNVHWPLLGAATCCCGRWKIAGSLEYRDQMSAVLQLQRCRGWLCHSVVFKQNKLLSLDFNSSFQTCSHENYLLPSWPFVFRCRVNSKLRTKTMRRSSM